MPPQSPDLHAAWMRLAQAISIADRVAAPVECETTVRVSQAMLGMSADEIVAAKAAAMEYSVSSAVGVIKAADLKHRQRVLLGLVNVAFADGEFRSDENRCLAAIAAALELDRSMLVEAFAFARMASPIDEITANQSVVS